MLKLKYHFRSSDAPALFEKLISRSPGNCRWFGSGIRFLSLPQAVTVDSFRALAANLHPVHGIPLVASGDEAEGKSAPLFAEIVITLTPSVAFLLDRSFDICAAHYHASAAAMSYLEIFAAGPAVREGIPCEVVSSNVVGISFDCFTSFAGTPMPQIRYLLFSLTYDEEEEKWLSLSTAEISDECECATRIYLSELCPDWEDRGLEIADDTPDPSGWDSLPNLN